MSTSNADLRMHPRWILKSNVSVFKQESKEYLGLLVDCSEQGLMISTYDSLTPGTRLRLELVDIPSNVSDRRSGQCTAEVIWCDKLTPSLYGNGFRITEHSPMLGSMLKSYAQTHNRTMTAKAN